MIASIPSRFTTPVSRNDEINRMKQNLQQRMNDLRDFLNNTTDIVDISDRARDMAAAANKSPVIWNSATAVNRAGGVDDLAGVATRGERAGTAKNYNQILEDLRAEYGEEEAMRRFDEIMRADGYEIVTKNDGNGIGPNGGLTPNRHEMYPSLTTAGLTMPQSTSNGIESNLNTYSSIRGEMGPDGEPLYLAETYANYASTLNQDVRDALAGVYGKNMASAQKGADFDLREYMSAHFGENPQTSAVSASTDLGTVAADLLQKAGVEPGADGRMSFYFNRDGSLSYSGSFDEQQRKAIDTVLAKNPDIAKAFETEYSRVAMTGTSGLAGAYGNGTRSVEYAGVTRSFTYSTAEPSAVVMTDSIAVRSTGYNYQKKVSDSFDINADMRMALDGGLNLATMDFAGAQKVREGLQGVLDEAAASGGLFASTMTRAQHNAIQETKQGGRLYEAVQRTLRFGTMAPTGKLRQ